MQCVEARSAINWLLIIKYSPLVQIAELQSNTAHIHAHVLTPMRKTTYVTTATNEKGGEGAHMLALLMPHCLTPAWQKYQIKKKE